MGCMHRSPTRNCSIGLYQLNVREGCLVAWCYAVYMKLLLSGCVANVSASFTILTTYHAHSTQSEFINIFTWFWPSLDYLSTYAAHASWHRGTGCCSLRHCALNGHGPPAGSHSVCTTIWLYVRRPLAEKIENGKVHGAADMHFNHCVFSVSKPLKAEWVYIVRPILCCVHCSTNLL